MKKRNYVILESDSSIGVFKKYDGYKKDYKISESIHVITDVVNGEKKHTYRLVVINKTWLDRILD